MCARATGRFRKREGEKGQGEREREHVIVRYGATIIKGKCRGRESSVTSRGGRNFSSLGTYYIRARCNIRCRAGCRELLCIRRALCECIYYVSSAGPMRARAYAISETDAPARPQSLTCRYACIRILLHPRLVHHAYIVALR